MASMNKGREKIATTKATKKSKAIAEVSKEFPS